MEMGKDRILRGVPPSSRTLACSFAMLHVDTNPGQYCRVFSVENQGQAFLTCGLPGTPATRRQSQSPTVELLKNSNAPHYQCWRSFPRRMPALVNIRPARRLMPHTFCFRGNPERGAAEPRVEVHATAGSGTLGSRAEFGLSPARAAQLLCRPCRAGSTTVQTRDFTPGFAVARFQRWDLLSPRLERILNRAEAKSMRH
jgi:hypothetical protein